MRHLQSASLETGTENGTSSRVATSVLLSEMRHGGTETTRLPLRRVRFELRTPLSLTLSVHLASVSSRYAFTSRL